MNNTEISLCRLCFPSFQHLQEWIDRSWQWLLSVGINESFLSKSVHSDNKLAHYARACTDITFKYDVMTVFLPFVFGEP